MTLRAKFIANEWQLLDKRTQRAMDKASAFRALTIHAPPTHAH